MCQEEENFRFLEYNLEIYKEALSQADKINSRIMSIRQLVFSTAIILPIIGVAKDFISLSATDNKSTAMDIPINIIGHPFFITFTLIFSILASIIILIVKYLEIGVYHPQLRGVVHYIDSIEQQFFEKYSNSDLIGFKNGLGMSQYICYYSRLSENILEKSINKTDNLLDKTSIKEKYSNHKDIFLKRCVVKKIYDYVLELVLLPLNLINKDYNTASRKTRLTYNCLVFWIILISFGFTCFVNTRNHETIVNINYPQSLSFPYKLGVNINYDKDLEKQIIPN